MDESDKMVLHTANDIYAASLIYTDVMLTEVNDVVAQAYEMINNQYGRMVEVLEEKAKLIADNKAELMASLKELSEDDRYAQILELGQLLSFELYNERMKARNLETASRPIRNISVESRADMPFMQQEKQPEPDSAFAEPDVKQPKLDSAFAEPEVKQPELDSAFAEPEVKQPELDSAFAEPEAKQPELDSAFVEPQEMQTGFDMAAATEIKPEDSKDAVARTLNMFKNYTPATRPVNGEMKNDK